MFNSILPNRLASPALFFNNSNLRTGSNDSLMYFFCRFHFFNPTYIDSVIEKAILTSRVFYVVIFLKLLILMK